MPKTKRANWYMPPSTWKKFLGSGATLPMVYDHQRHDPSNKLNEIQHHSHHDVLAATQVHLDHDNCLEVVIMKGRSGEIKRLADRMLSMRGVKHGKLVITSTGREL